jgi:hypothetical protein
MLFGTRSVQLEKTKDNRYLAAVGKEIFEVQTTLSLVDGKILFATMDNRVERAISEGTSRHRVTKAKPSSANAEAVFEPFPITEVPWEEFSHGQRFGMRATKSEEEGFPCITC